jgi:hypothetical protein
VSFKSTIKGKFKPKNPQKYKGNPTNIIFRSSYELRFMRFCDNDDRILRWSSEEVIIPYRSPIDKRIHRYFPDFLVQMKRPDGSINTMLIEIKPAVQTKEPKKQTKITKRYINEVFTWGVNEAKWKAAEEYCKDIQWEFKIFTEKELGIKY